MDLQKEPKEKTDVESLIVTNTKVEVEISSSASGGLCTPFDSLCIRATNLIQQNYQND